MKILLLRKKRLLFKIASLFLLALCSVQASENPDTDAPKTTQDNVKSAKVNLDNSPDSIKIDVTAALKSSYDRRTRKKTSNSSLPKTKLPPSRTKYDFPPFGRERHNVKRPKKKVNLPSKPENQNSSSESDISDEDEDEYTLGEAFEDLKEGGGRTFLVAVALVILICAFGNNLLDFWAERVQGYKRLDWEEEKKKNENFLEQYHGAQPVAIGVSPHQKPQKRKKGRSPILVLLAGLVLALLALLAFILGRNRGQG